MVLFKFAPDIILRIYKVMAYLIFPLLIFMAIVWDKAIKSRHSTDLGYVGIFDIGLTDLLWPGILFFFLSLLVQFLFNTFLQSVIRKSR